MLYIHTYMYLQMGKHKNSWSVRDPAVLGSMATVGRFQAREV